MIKIIVKILFFGGLAGLFIYGALVLVEKSDQKKSIDKTVTYTTSSTFSKTIDLNFKPSKEEVVESIADYVTVPAGGLDWKLLSKTESLPYSFEGEDAKPRYGVKPGFTPELQKWDGQVVIMQGYMFPLSAGEAQSVFLFGPFPVSCPYHYHVGPALVIEAHGKEQLKFSFEPVTIEGKLELVPRDDEYSVFYRLHDVVLKP